jgi:phospholipid-binding lipoprotein MlaA
MAKSVIVPVLVVASLSIGAAGCTQREAGVEFTDPYESTNRRAHEFNKELDRAILKPAALAYTALTPKPVQQGVSNFATNLSQPANVVNYMMQGNVAEAINTTGIFLVNSLIGVGGIFDIAGREGHFARDTDFGETLSTWGVKEGAYIELTGLGPTTERGAVGKVVDFVMDPLASVLSVSQSKLLRVASVSKVLEARVEYGDALDSVLYDSADSYTQTRLYYLQNRRYELGTQPQDIIDPFEEMYGTE